MHTPSNSWGAGESPRSSAARAVWSVLRPWARTSAVQAIAVISTASNVGPSPIRPPTWMKSAISITGTARKTRSRVYAMLALSRTRTYVCPDPGALNRARFGGSWPSGPPSWHGAASPVCLVAGSGCGRRPNNAVPPERAYGSRISLRRHQFLRDGRLLSGAAPQERSRPAHRQRTAPQRRVRRGLEGGSRDRQCGGAPRPQQDDGSAGFPRRGRPSPGQGRPPVVRRGAVPDGGQRSEG